MNPKPIQVYEGGAVWPNGQDGLTNIRLMVCEQNEHEIVRCLASEDGVIICSPRLHQSGRGFYRNDGYFAGEELIVYRFDTDKVYRTVQLCVSGADICDFTCHGLEFLE
jgi:hypothetical protein